MQARKPYGCNSSSWNYSHPSIISSLFMTTTSWHLPLLMPNLVNFMCVLNTLTFATTLFDTQLQTITYDLSTVPRTTCSRTHLPKPFPVRRQNTLLEALDLFQLEGKCWSPSRTPHTNHNPHARQTCTHVYQPAPITSDPLLLPPIVHTDSLSLLGPFLYHL